MADLSQHTNYTGAYSGLLDNLWVTLCVAGACLVGYELEVHVPRRHGREGTFERIPVRLYRAAGRAWRRQRLKSGGGGSGEERTSEEGLVRERKDEGKATTDARNSLGSRESWEFGYIYQPRAWRLNPLAPVPLWPLGWIASSLKIREKDMPEACGLDITLHMRFLRGAFFYTLLQSCVVLPSVVSISIIATLNPSHSILLPLHIFYSPPSVSRTSMTRASISSLVESSGAHWLWIHSILIWWLTITWTLTVLWITWGALAYRRREIEKLKITVENARVQGTVRSLAPQSVGSTDPEGLKRFRTLMVENIPPDMRNEDVLRHYFDHYLHRHRVKSGQITPPEAQKQPEPEKEGSILRRVHFRPNELFKKRPDSFNVVPKSSVARRDSNDNIPRDGTQEEFDVVDDDSADGMWESEVDEVILVRKLGTIASLRARRTAVLRQLEIAHVKLAKRVLSAVARNQSKHPAGPGEKRRTAIHPEHNAEKGIDGLNAQRDEGLPAGISEAERVQMLVQALGGYVGDRPEQLGEGGETLWDVLHALPRELLDPYQALTHFKVTSIYRKQNAPLVDYLTTKLNYLTILLDEAREKPLSSYGSSSTAFVTFKDARTARLALKVLDSHPTRTLACRTLPAPDWTNLLWPRLGMSVYRSEFIRKWVVSVGVWAFTLIWIFPVSILCALSSFTNIAGFIPSLKDFLSTHPKVASAISSLAPVILVAGLTLCICPILLVIANKAETTNTRLAIHNSVLERFWKFLMVNGVVFFAIGQTAIEAYLTAFQDSDFDPLPLLASAFPTAAPYFASYILLQTAIQPFFELFRFGLPTIIYVFGTRRSIVPRQRRSRTEYPTFSHFSAVPQQVLAGAIMHLFMLLNPLVIPFALVYYGCCYIVWKRQFTYVYGRLYENNGRRTSVRVLRYSLDALALAQFVLFAFFILNKAKGPAIATGFLFFLTLGEKLVISRALKRRFDNLDIDEADLLCPPVPGDDDDQLTIVTSDPATPSKSNTRPSGLESWFHKWAYASSHRNGVGYRRPIPFDHILFGFLDRKIKFALPSQDQTPAVITPSPADTELKHEPDHAITHAPAGQLITPHPRLQPWEDIPPYPRSRGYNDQPPYTDDYDDYMWLPRDPLSTLDLDDTVEMRLSLTTSNGGTGRIGAWPPVVEAAVADMGEAEGVWQEVTTGPSTIIRSDIPTGTTAEPTHHSGDFLEIPSHIGSEVYSGASGLMRRGTKRMEEGLNNVFRRPRAGTNRTDHSGVISMRTLSIHSARSHEVAIPEARQTTSPEAVPHSPYTAPAAVRPATLPAQSASTPVVSMLDLHRPHPTTSNSTASEPIHSILDEGRVSSPLPIPTPTPVTAALVESPDPVEQLEPSPTSPLTTPPLPTDPPKPLSRLGRTASGRRPSRLFSPTPSTPTGGRDRLHSGISTFSPARSTSSVFAPDHLASRARLQTFEGGLGRKPSVTAAQHALMQEVMAEERLNFEDDKKQEELEKVKEAEELMREREKARRVSQLEGGLDRRGSTGDRPSLSGRNSSRRSNGIGRPGSSNGRQPSATSSTLRESSRQLAENRPATSGSTDSVGRLRVPPAVSSPGLPGPPAVHQTSLEALPVERSESDNTLS